MSKELKFEFNDYIIAIDEPYENDCGYVAIGKKDTKGNINIWFKSLNEQTVDFYIELQKHIADLEAKLAEKDRAIENWQTMYQSVMQSCHNGIEEDKRLREHLAEWERDSNATLNEYRAIKYENKQLNKALELAVQQLDDAKDMLRECGKQDWANTLDASAYYFKARAKEMKDE